MEAMTLLSVADASARHGLAVSRLRQLVAEGIIKGQKYGKTWVLDERSLKTYLAKDRRPGPKPKKRSR